MLLLLLKKIVIFKLMILDILEINWSLLLRWEVGKAIFVRHVLDATKQFLVVVDTVEKGFYNVLFFWLVIFVGNLKKALARTVSLPLIHRYVGLYPSKIGATVVRTNYLACYTFNFCGLCK